jgi:hypothetical protein
MTRSRGSWPTRRTSRIPNRELERLIEEATVDAYGDSEQVTAIFTMIEDNLAMPFETIVLGGSVVVRKIDLTDRDEIVAVCESGRHRQRVPILDLPLPTPRPAGAEWIEAYGHWCSRRR